MSYKTPRGRVPPLKRAFHKYRSLHGQSTERSKAHQCVTAETLKAHNFLRDSQGILIPVRYDWNSSPDDARMSWLPDFNSSKVRLEPCGHKCGLCLCITWLLWQRYDKNREKIVDVGKLISNGAMTTVFQRGTMLSKNSNFNFHEQY